jgi:DNA polymerase III sliding clamp (beta) subunit (PCNA family)
MEFYIETAEFQRVVSLLSITAKTNTTDSSGRICIEAREDNTISFLSNNGSTGILIDADKTIVKEPGEVAVLYSKVKSFVSSFNPWNETYGAKEFRFVSNQKDTFMSVVNVNENGKTSRGRLKLNTSSVYDIRRPEPFEKATFVLNSTIFKDAVSKVLYAIDPNGDKAFLRGMNIHFDKDYIYFAGTNGRKLSEYKVKNVSDVTEGSYIIQHDFIMGLRRALKEDYQVFFNMSARTVQTHFDGILFWGRKVVGEEYPSYEEELNKFRHSIMLSKDILLSILAPFSDVLDSNDDNRLTIHLREGVLAIYNDYASFEYEESLDFDDEFVMDLNGRFFIETVDSIKDDVLLIKFSDEEGHLILDSANFEDQKSLITSIRRR